MNEDLFTQDSLDLHAFGSKLFCAIEELSLRRASDVENEQKIDQLIKEQYQLQTKLVDAEARNVKAEEVHEDRISTIQKASKAKCKSLQEDKEKLSWVCERTEKEMKSLKEDIRTLQLDKYSLEKRLREHERKDQLTRGPSINNCSRITELELLCQKLTTKVTQLTALQDTLESNVVEASQLHQRLSYVNTHQQCQLRANQVKMQELEAQLQEARITVDLNPSLAAERETHHAREVEQLQQQVANNDQMIHQLNYDLKDAKSQTQKSLGLLREAHQLVDRHVMASNEQDTHVTSLCAQLTKLTEEQAQLQEAHDSTLNDLQKERENWGVKAELSIQENCSLREELSNVEEKYKCLSEAHSQLEELNTKWAQKSVDLTALVESLKIELDKPKTAASTQTELDTGDNQTQTEVKLCNVDTQATPSTSEVATEPFIAITCVYTQTERGEHSMDVSSQTPKVEVISSASQCDTSSSLTPRTITQDEITQITEKTCKVQHSPNIQHPEVTLPSMEQSSSQPVISQSTKIAEDTDLSSSQPAMEIETQNSSSQHMSPQSRFEARMQSISQENHDLGPQMPPLTELMRQKKNCTFHSTPVISPLASDLDTPQKHPFQFLNLPKPSQPPPQEISVPMAFKVGVSPACLQSNPTLGEPTEATAPDYLLSPLSMSSISVPCLAVSPMLASMSPMPGQVLVPQSCKLRRPLSRQNKLTPQPDVSDQGHSGRETKSIVGILQDCGSRSKRVRKQVHFAECLDHKTPRLIGSLPRQLDETKVAMGTPASQEEMILFSDDEEEHIELGTQVASIESMLS